MRAGLLRHYVRIERMTVARDEYGGEVRTWAPVSHVYAEIKPTRAREFVDGGATEQHITHTITLRHCPGLLPTDRIVHDGRTFSFQPPINPSERNIMTELLATEVL